MICQVIIQDCLIERRMVYLLNDADFADLSYESLSVPRCQHGVVTWLNAVAAESDVASGDPTNPIVKQLTDCLCALIVALQGGHSRIECLKLTRVTAIDLLCDYIASVA